MEKESTTRCILPTVWLALSIVMPLGWFVVNAYACWLPYQPNAPDVGWCNFIFLKQTSCYVDVCTFDQNYLPSAEGFFPFVHCYKLIIFVAAQSSLCFAIFIGLGIFANRDRRS